ncbi:MAG: hypothetical protein Q9184_004705 [Pyrenodesmia sp. 2 TL-2023]
MKREKSEYWSEQQSEGLRNTTKLGSNDVGPSAMTFDVPNVVCWMTALTCVDEQREPVNVAGVATRAPMDGNGTNYPKSCAIGQYTPQGTCEESKELIRETQGTSGIANVLFLMDDVGNDERD